MNEDIKRSNYFKVSHKTEWTLRDVVEHFNPEETFEQVRERVVKPKADVKPVMVRHGK